MASDNSNKSVIIDELIGLLRVGKLDAGGIILVKEAELRHLLDAVSIEELTKSRNTFSSTAPDIESPEFRTWMIAQREARGWSQSKLAREINARPEQINRYEGNQKPLKNEFLEKIKTLFSPK
jgi:ribosome-binding protein aMBF1 (putative translation factor)